MKKKFLIQKSLYIETKYFIMNLKEVKKRATINAFIFYIKGIFQYH